MSSTPSVRLKVGGCQGHASLAAFTNSTGSPHRYGGLEVYVEPVHLQGAEKHCNLYHRLILV